VSAVGWRERQDITLLATCFVSNLQSEINARPQREFCTCDAVQCGIDACAAASMHGFASTIM
jgi:hypothetical protein